MAQKTLINGTSYGLSGGRTLVNGTGYNIPKGKTLINGTGYDIGFLKTFYISGTGSFDSGCGYVVINGTKYTSSFSNVPITEGTSIEIKVSVSTNESSDGDLCSIKLNGSTIYDRAVIYSFTPTNNCTINFTKHSTYRNWTLIYYWTADITM